MKNSSYHGLISLIISTYNWPEALYLVLMSLNNQVDKHFEVLIVDDGSTDETRMMIDTFQTQAKFPLTHLWQEDQGFRAAKVRNLGIKHANGEYVIFLDGDCIPNISFISNHRKLIQKNHFVVGHRIILSRKFTKETLQKKSSLWQKKWLYWIINRIKGNSNKFFPKLYLAYLNRHKQPNKWLGAKTCNLAFWKSDLTFIKGFDESFEGWGFEDSDLVIRVLNSGKKRKSGKYATEVFHLWHKEADRSQESKNLSHLQQLLKTQRTKPSDSSL